MAIDPMSSISPLTVGEDLARIVQAPLDWARFKNQTVMVSGGAGVLASYLVQSLLHANNVHALNLTVVCLSRSAASIQNRLQHWLNDPHLKVMVHDVTQPLPGDAPRADFIIHAASQASPKFYGIDPAGTLLANTAGTQYLLEHAVRSQAQRFMFFSSGEVYGVPMRPELPVTETSYGYLDPINVRSCYAEGKRVGETLCSAWAKQYGLHTVVVRPFHTYGPGLALDDGRVFADFVADVIARRDIVLKSDGLAQRPFCYVADATIGFLTVLLQGAIANAYNIANPATEISMRDLAYTVAGLFPERAVGVRFDIPVATDAYLKSPIARSCPSIDKVRALGWTPTTGIAEGFRRTIQSYLD